jgi:hypothetical protein
MILHASIQENGASDFQNTANCDLVICLGMQDNGSQVEKPCKEEAKEPEEEARALGLQVNPSSSL